MLEFYHHFILKSLKLDKYELKFINTDSFYFGLPIETFDDNVEELKIFCVKFKKKRENLCI